jgi:predicted secreted protein
MRPFKIIIPIAFFLLLCTTAFSQVKDSVIYVHPGKLFTIKVASSPSTGYAWQLSDSINVRLLKKVSASSSYRANPGKKPMLGRVGLQLFTFKALKKGTAYIKIMNVQPWTKPTPPNTDRRNYLVKIK